MFLKGFGHLLFLTLTLHNDLKRQDLSMLYACEPTYMERQKGLLLNLFLLVRVPEGHARDADWLTDRIGLGSCRPLK